MANSVPENWHRQLWAKSDQNRGLRHDLWRHMLDVAAVTKALWPLFGPLEDVPLSWVCYLNALHDIGKADPWFQNKDATLACELVALGLALPERDTARDDNQRKFRHEARSREWLFDHLQQHSWDDKAIRVVIHAVNGHHGDFGADCYSEADLEMARTTWQPLRKQLAQLVWDVLQPPSYTPCTFVHAGSLGITWSGLLVLSDWIASNPDLFPYVALQQEADPKAYFEAAQKCAAQVVKNLGFTPTSVTARTTPSSFGEVWPAIKTLRPFQRVLEHEVLAGHIAPGLAIIEAPMGEGKTEAAIYLAEVWNSARGRSGAYIALPTQATSNQMHGRYKKYLQTRHAEAAPRLVHGMAWLLDEDQKKSPNATSHTYGDETEGGQSSEQLLSREWFRPLRRALLAPEGVGTVDQALMAALHVKFGFLRLLGLRNKVLIVDEAHAYDAYMTTILERLLSWCRALEIPVILLSATLSAAQKQRLVTAYSGDSIALSMGENEPYPLLTTVALDGATYAVGVEKITETADEPSSERQLHLKAHLCLLDDAEATAQLALERVRDGGCACVLMNSVKGAQNVYRVLDKLTKDDQTIQLKLFHARFRAEERQGIEAEVEKMFGKDTVTNGLRPQRAILVATQVVEQSLDVDFDFFITQIAPIDLLLQRSGRLHRHLRQNRPGGEPILDILMPSEGVLQFGVSEKIYAREVLLRTLAVLHGRCKLELPTEFRPLIEAVYASAIPFNEVVPLAEIVAARLLFLRQQAEEQGKARAVLLLEPSTRAFSMVGRDKKEAESEAAGASYLHASTRLGDDSRAALVLRDPELIKAALSSQNADAKAPRRDLLRRLFLQKVNLPAWWLRELEAAQGYSPIFEGGNWLRHHFVVPLRGDEWHSQSGAVLRDDPKLGLLLMPPPQTPQGEEADAGTTG